jgi:hypothetical protein
VVSARGGKGERRAGNQHDNRGHQNVFHFIDSQISDIEGVFLRLAIGAARMSKRVGAIDIGIGSSRSMSPDALVRHSM